MSQTTNNWLEFVKFFHQKNPKLSYQQALQEASIPYNKIKQSYNKKYNLLQLSSSSNAPPPYDDHQLPRYDDDLHNSVQKMKEQQSKIESLLKDLFTTNNATLSKTTQETIRNIMFIFESRFDLLEKELLLKITQAAEWMKSIPVVEKEHTEMKAQLEELLARTQLLDTHIKQIEKLEKKIGELKTKIVQLEGPSDVYIERWTDPKNQLCRIPDFNIAYFKWGSVSEPYRIVTDYLLKPPPVSSDSGVVFLYRKRHEYVCPCYNCILNDIYQKSGSISGDWGGMDTIERMCPLDSDCTCMTKIHRDSYIHSIDVGYVKGRDEELSSIQVLYCTFVKKNRPGIYMVALPSIKFKDIGGGILTTQNGELPFPNGIADYVIVNFTQKEDGTNMYQYQNQNTKEIHEILEDKLYIYISGKHFVPIYKYLEDTMFSNSLVREERDFEDIEIEGNTFLISTDGNVYDEHYKKIGNYDIQQKKWRYGGPQDVKAGGSLYDNKGKLLYRGQVKNGLPHGYGTGYYTTGKVGHVGMFKGGKIVQ